MCKDRQRLNHVIDQWKEHKAAQGDPVQGASRSDIIRSLKTRWDIIDRRSNVSVSIIWTADGADRHTTPEGGAKSRIDNIAISFYNAKLRDDPSLRRRCSDRHVLDATIDRWMANERLDGTPIVNASRSSIIFSLRKTWKLIHTKLTEDNVIIWTADMASSRVNSDDEEDPQPNSADDRESRIRRTVARIKNSRAEMQSNRNGIVIDDIDFGVNGGVCRVGHRAYQQVKICNESDIDVICDIKSEAARQRNFQVEGESVFELPAWGSTSIGIAYTPKVIGVSKSILVFNFDPVCCDEDGEIEPFSIVRYIAIRAGDPDDFEFLKPTAPYAKKSTKKEDKEKFSNPVRVRSSQPVASFENPLASYFIPKDIERLASNENEASQVLDSIFRGEESYFDKDEKVNYPSTFTIDNYSKCMQHLLWLEEAQMKGMYFLLLVTGH